MKRFKYDMPTYMVVLLILGATALTVTAVFRFLHLIGAGNMVSFYPVLDIAVTALSLAISTLCVYAIFGSGYRFGACLQVVLAVPVFLISYDKIIRIIKGTDGKLWLTIDDNGRERALRIAIKPEDENDFVAAVRSKKADVTYEAEIK